MIHICLPALLVSLARSTRCLSYGALPEMSEGADLARPDPRFNEQGMIRLAVTRRPINRRCLSHRHHHFPLTSPITISHHHLTSSRIERTAGCSNPCSQSSSPARLPGPHPPCPFSNTARIFSCYAVSISARVVCSIRTLCPAGTAQPSPPAPAASLRTTTTRTATSNIKLP